MKSFLKDKLDFSNEKEIFNQIRETDTMVLAVRPLTKAQCHINGDRALDCQAIWWDKV